MLVSRGAAGAMGRGQENFSKTFYRNALITRTAPLLLGIGMNKQATALFIALIFLCSESLPIVFSQTSSRALISAPAIALQKGYGHSGAYDDTNVESASNLIQTSDGGYIFMDLGWRYQGIFSPSIVYKVDSAGSSQWNKTIDSLVASTIIQTNDERYEIAGQWYSTTNEYTPTLIKMDSQGNIQWVANYSSVPDLGIASTRIQTSDGGFAYWTDGSITKTCSDNSTEWVKTFNYTGADGTAPLELSSVIETSDGALAALGVGYSLLDNPRTGKIYLIKTEAFLPLPSQTPLPTPVATPIPASAVEVTIAILVPIIVVAVVGLLFFLRKRKR